MRPSDRVRVLGERHDLEHRRAVRSCTPHDDARTVDGTGRLSNPAEGQRRSWEASPPVD